MDGDWNMVQTALKDERARPAYKLGVRYEQPGIFYLGFVLRNTPARENFSVLPSGYYYRKKVIRSAQTLLDSCLRVTHPHNNMPCLAETNFPSLALPDIFSALFPAKDFTGSLAAAMSNTDCILLSVAKACTLSPI